MLNRQINDAKNRNGYIISNIRVSSHIHMKHGGIMSCFRCHSAILHRLRAGGADGLVDGLLSTAMAECPLLFTN